MRSYKRFSRRKKPLWFMGIPYCVYVSHGSWSDGEVYYKGKIANAYSVEEELWQNYKYDCEELGEEPGDWSCDNEKFNAWAKKNGHYAKEYIQEFGEKSVCRLILAYI